LRFHGAHGGFVKAEQQLFLRVSPCGCIAALHSNLWLFGCSDARRHAWLRWRAFFDVVAYVALFCLGFCGVGLSLICWWSISVAPVRGGTYFLCRRKER
jgi:hypothetical protein